VIALVVSLLAGCSPSGSSEAVTPTARHTVTSIRPAPTPASDYVPAPATAVAPLGRSNAPMPSGETEGPCPYIANADLADAEGDHVYRTSVVTTTNPVGCRFYFYAAPYQAIADILPTTFADATDAYNAMVATAGPSALPVQNLVPGVTAELFQTRFNSGDGDKDWACAFAKGRVMVVVHTQQTNISFNARAIAAAIAVKF